MTTLSPALQLIRNVLWLGPPTAARPPAGSGTWGTSRLAQTLEDHRLTGTFYDRIRENPHFPGSVGQALSAATTNIRLRLLQQTAELHRMLAVVQQSAIRVVALKGPALAQRYHGGPTRRECNDLDLLVPPESVEQALAIFLAQGYFFSEILWETPVQKAVYAKNFHHYHLYHAEKGTIVELHWRLYSSAHIDRAMDLSVWDRLESCRLGNLTVKVLSRHDSLIYLTVHGGGHRWRRLFWVYDIAVILQKEGGAFVEETYRRALSWGAGRYVLLGCHLARVLFGVVLPGPIEGAIARSPEIETLAALSLSALDQGSESGSSPLASRQRFLLGLKGLKNHHRAAYLLGGFRALLGSFRRFFVNPAYWRIHAFDDRFFFLNYAAAPFLWVYSHVRKHKE